MNCAKRNSLFVFDGNDTKINVEYEIESRNNGVIVKYYIKNQDGDSKNKTVQENPEFLRAYEREIIRLSHIVTEQVGVTSKKSPGSTKNDLPENMITTKRSTLKFANSFSMLESFKSREITSYIQRSDDEQPIAATCVSIFGDCSTLICDKNYKNGWISFHRLNVKITEFIIASKLKSFIQNLSKIAQALTVVVAISTLFIHLFNPEFGSMIFKFMDVFSASSQTIPNQDYTYRTVFDAILDLAYSEFWKIVHFAIVGIMISFGRKWIGSIFLRIALKNIFNQLKKTKKQRIKG